MKHKTFYILFTFICLLLGSTVWAQKGLIEGTIEDDSEALIGANIVIKGTSIGAVTDLNGNFTLEVDPGSYELEASYLGYQNKTISVTVASGQTVVIAVLLSQGILVDEIVITGTRAANRTNTDSPVPIDVINVNKLTASAPQTDLNQLLHYTTPSFSSNTQTISDGTDHIDPASLRGLGPDQVLVLIDGKRRHNTSLVNVNGTFGRGNVGTDLNAIPAAAINNIEVLRDGAAAQYGSDAIAGVINLRLRDEVNQLRFTVRTGANFTAEASPQKDIDGAVTDVAANYGIPLGGNGGFINMTGRFQYRDWTNRMQSFEGSIFNAYNAIENVAAADGADLSNLSMQDIQSYAGQVSHFSSEFAGLVSGAPTMDSLQILLGTNVTDAELAARGQTRSDYNMRVGQSAVRGGQFFANLSVPMGETMELYGFGGLSFREGNSGCFYRLPNQNRTYTPTYINGHIPEINSQISDQSIAMGIRGQVKGWDVDLSNTWGKNKFIFFMTNTANTTLQNSSPTEFNSGGHSFLQNTGNLDISRYFEVDGIRGINVAFGSEFRFEEYEVIPGTEFSYGNYDVNGNLVNPVTPDNLFVTDALGRQRPSGAQCFAGFLPLNEVDAKRNSIAGYLDTEFDINDEFLVNAALRFENYSDFGSTLNYKIAARYKITDNLTVRAANSSGFRAPSLHQIHFSRTSTIFVTENNVTTAQEVGVFSNNSRAAQLLGIPQLKEETSNNISVGITAKIPDAGIRITIDAYRITIDDRIVLTGQFAPGDNMELAQIFSQAQATRAAFFANAIDTESRGIDVVISHKVILGKGVLTNNLAGTFSKTEQSGEIMASPVLEEAGLVDTYFDETSRIFLEEAVPRVKVTLSNTYEFKGLSVYLRNTYFGETTEATNVSALAPGVDFTNEARIVTDLSIGYDFAPNLNLTIGANNLFDIYPDLSDETFTSDGRFLYSRGAPQFSINGRFLFAKLAFTLK